MGLPAGALAKAGGGRKDHRPFSFVLDAESSGQLRARRPDRGTDYADVVIRGRAQPSPTSIRHILNLVFHLGADMVEKGVTRPLSGTKYDALHSELHSLQAALRDSRNLSNSQKRQLSAEIEKMKEHLLTPAPSGHALRTMWSGIEHFVIAGDFLDYAARIAALLAELTV